MAINSASNPVKGIDCFSKIYRELQNTWRSDFVWVILTVGHSLYFLYYELLVKLHMLLEKN